MKINYGRFETSEAAEMDVRGTRSRGRRVWARRMSEKFFVLCQYWSRGNISRSGISEKGK